MMVRTIIGFTAFVVLILAFPNTSYATCVVHWTCSSSGCTADMGGSSGTAGPFATDDECEQWRSQYDSNSTCDCSDDNDSDSSSSDQSSVSAPSIGGSMQDLEMGGLMLGGYMVGKGLHDLLFGNPQQQAQQRAQEAAQAAEQQRQAEERARQEELIKEQLLGEAPSGSGSSGGLHLMGVISENNLQLMTGEQALAPITSSATQAAPKVATSERKKVKHSDAFNKGYHDASQCYSQSIETACSSISDSSAYLVCKDDYLAGFEIGTKEEQMKIDEATKLGMLEAEDGKPNNGFTVTEDTGDCRDDLDMAYTNGYQQIIRPKATAGGK